MHDRHSIANARLIFSNGPIAPLSMTNMDSLSLASDAAPDRVAAHPRVQRVPAKDITLFIRRDFLNAEECARLIARIDANRRPSTIADANGDGYFRHSDTCALDHADRKSTRLNSSH